MPIETNKKKQNYAPRGGGSSKSGKTILRALVAIALIILLGLCLFGYINQKQTGITILQTITNTGKSVGDTLTKIFVGDDDAPINITDEGIYIDGYEPSSAQKLPSDQQNTQQ